MCVLHTLVRAPGLQSSSQKQVALPGSALFFHAHLRSSTTSSNSKVVLDLPTSTYGVHAPCRKPPDLSLQQGIPRMHDPRVDRIRTVGR